MPTSLPGSPAADGSGRIPGFFTRSLCRAGVSARGVDGRASTIFDMDAVAVLIGIFMFAVLYALIYGIDRI
jgi:hypothetical protein